VDPEPAQHGADVIADGLDAELQPRTSFTIFSAAGFSQRMIPCASMT